LRWNLPCKICRAMSTTLATLTDAPPKAAGRPAGTSSGKACTTKQSSSRRARRSSAQRSLSRAFETFQTAARSLEKSYGHLQREVLRLRFELEHTSRDLRASLEENARMRTHLARVLEGLPIGVVVTDSEGRILTANPEARRLLEPWAGQVGATAINSIFSELLCGARETPQSRHGEHELSIQPDSASRTIGVSCSVLGQELARSAAEKSVFLLRDTTEEKKQNAQKELIRRRESLAEMAALLAHEIRNPLGSLELFAGLLADATASQPDLRRWTDHMQAGLRLLSATVNNVLQYHSRPEPQLASLNLDRLMRESIEFLRPLARQSGLRIDFYNGLGDLEIPADAHRLQQVFFNLAVNAFRSMAIGGMLAIRIDWEDASSFRAVRIEFEDTGCGIPAEHFARLFDAGFTLTPGNPGLGLAVCKSVIEQHEGSIHVASEPGKGTIFTIVLPRERCER